MSTPAFPRRARSVWLLRLQTPDHEIRRLQDVAPRQPLGLLAFATALEFGVTRDNMPRTATGKILHRVLRQRLGG